MNIKSTALVFAAAAAVMIAPIATISDAEAKGRGHVTHQTFITKGPERGFEGFVGGAKGHNQYCSFRREPIRRCLGIGRCKIVAWKLVQLCY